MKIVVFYLRLRAGADGVAERQESPSGHERGYGYNA
jgi:hypothetical protein